MDSSLPAVSDVPQDLQFAIDEVLRIATREKFGVIGVVFRGDPPSVAIMRNSNDDPIATLKAATNMVEKLLNKNGVVNRFVYTSN